MSLSCQPVPASLNDGWKEGKEEKEGTNQSSHRAIFKIPGKVPPVYLGLFGFIWWFVS